MHRRFPTEDIKIPLNSLKSTRILSKALVEPVLLSPHKLGSTPKITTDKKYPKSYHLQGSPEDIKRKQKNFLEIMGLGDRSPVTCLRSPLLTSKATQKISVTDLMGTKKYAFLKQTGFLPIYNEFKRVQEIKTIRDKKHTLSHANIVHADIIRKCSFLQDSNSAKTKGNCENFVRNRRRKRTTKKVAQIEEIYRKCDLLSTEMRHAKRSIDLPFVGISFEELGKGYGGR